MKKRIYLIGYICLVCTYQAFGQSYGTTLGLRLGNDKIKKTVGLSMKHRVMKHVTLEGIVQTDFNHNTTFHGLIQHHRGVLTKRFNFYVGTGLAVGTEESIRKDREARQTITTYGNATLGIDLIVGLEFTLLKHNFSIDYKPNFNLAGRDPWYRGQVGLSARGVLVKGSTQNKRKRKRVRQRRQQQKAKERDEKQAKPLLGNFFNNVIKKKPGADNQ
ncbi:hypothetical protein QQ020_33930 [Fulvivirgaceae bacterium BMA12]|uniref:Outer membrane protein beta-barrel domain-containing protein n=1 Tax=Agaribacillus aureus TaxID=3051825 RepID=A0ABT8LJC6_9BACT|nr:hypothetical protein [Fulvivirgaceae bacterium BMA12]